MFQLLEQRNQCDNRCMDDNYMPSCNAVGVLVRDLGSLYNF